MTGPLATGTMRQRKRDRTTGTEEHEAENLRMQCAQPFSCEVFAALPGCNVQDYLRSCNSRRTDVMTAAMEVVSEARHKTTWLWQTLETAGKSSTVIMLEQ